jgi:hypothetical protein
MRQIVGCNVGERNGPWSPAAVFRRARRRHVLLGDGQCQVGICRRGEPPGLGQRISRDESEGPRFQSAGSFDVVLGDDDVSRHDPIVRRDLGDGECRLRKRKPARSTTLCLLAGP